MIPHTGLDCARAPPPHSPALLWLSALTPREDTAPLRRKGSFGVKLGDVGWKRHGSRTWHPVPGCFFFFSGVWDFHLKNKAVLSLDIYSMCLEGSGVWLQPRAHWSRPIIHLMNEFTSHLGLGLNTFMTLSAGFWQWFTEECWCNRCIHCLY